uniref:Secreted protein n=1 Tax=Mesocestoides corti TaxID=53468 RepID=A0A5K3EJM9_MESCO
MKLAQLSTQVGSLTGVVGVASTGFLRGVRGNIAFQSSRTCVVKFELCLGKKSLSREGVRGEGNPWHPRVLLLSPPSIVTSRRLQASPHPASTLLTRHPGTGLVARPVRQTDLLFLPN